MVENNKKLKQENSLPYYKYPLATVDIVIFSIINEYLHVLTVKRSEEPYSGMWSLVGGIIDIEHEQNLETTAKRKLQEKTNVESPYLEQFETFGNSKRDPRSWSITTVYFALISPQELELKIGRGVENIKWSKVDKGRIRDNLAFDHAMILEKCTERLRNKVLYTSLPVHLMPREFTLGELQKIYEIILNKKIDHKSFRRRMLNADILNEAKGMRHEGRKPAQLYYLKDDNNMHFFMRNLESATEEKEKVKG